ncbi:hypothetical protein [Polaromonas sp.]|uniref:hypothetical protein n=1 Tax=Polaromonas sp. TaxID=1869339 RepID=UPI00272FB929|nr:hypothetical protein [Polaromonas sp.]MDP2449542.1 hypothetical protein [Polaromonas sp.]
MSKDYDNIDYTQQAAHYLRQSGVLPGKIGSSHAHALVAASLGFGSRIAMRDDPDGPSFANQWLGREEPNVPKISEIVAQMRSTSLRPEEASAIAKAVQDGLTPACACGLHSHKSMPIGFVHENDEAEWVCPECAADVEEFGICGLCGTAYIYRTSELDHHGLCKEHRGEFEQSDEEREDQESFAEYVLNHD